MMRLISLVGNPTAVKTSSIVTNPALGTLAAPILARVAVKLRERNDKMVVIVRERNPRVGVTLSKGNHKVVAKLREKNQALLRCSILCSS